MRSNPLGGGRHKAYWRFIVFVCLISASLLKAQEATVADLQGITGYAPSVYFQPFSPCSGETLCTRTDEFKVDPVPKGCCVLTVTNGNGQGKDEVQSYEVVLNDKNVVPANHSPNVRANVKVLNNNTIKVILIGGPNSKVWVLISYDPRQSQ
jgi:hypothetical protein